MCVYVTNEENEFSKVNLEIIYEVVLITSGKE